jgi:hypothetical protein
MSYSPPNVSGEQRQMIEALARMSHAMRIAASDLQAMEQGIDAFFGTVSSPESSLDLMDLQPSALTSMVDAGLNAWKR